MYYKKHKYKFNRKLEDINSLIKNLIQEKNWAPALIEASAVDIYNSMEVSIIKDSKALFVSNGSLVISCPSNALANEIALSQSFLINSINKKVGKRVIHKLRFQIY